MSAILLNACATPAQRFSQAALEAGFSATVVKSDHYHHQLFYNDKALQAKTLHVYLDGDGTPWSRSGWPSIDPTSRNPLILQMMMQDESPALFIGRPCYHGVGQNDDCDEKLWTSGRYSYEVVQSLLQVSNRWVKTHRIEEVVFIGYSGGGTLAVLMAPNALNLIRVVTIAANLDVDAWNAFHGYPPFELSLNPADQIEAVKNIEQIHFAGGLDKVAPTEIIEKFANTSPKFRYQLYPNYSHHCCWVDAWPNILQKILD